MILKNTSMVLRIAIVLVLTLANSFFTLNVSAKEMKLDTVIVLHGIARTLKSMTALERQLTKDGYEVLNIDYPSTDYDIETLADYVYDATRPAFEDKSRTVHFVGHSIGNLVPRALLHKHRPARMGRVVMLAPPNQGSEIADLVKNISAYKFFYGPAGQQLTTDQSAIAPLLGPVVYETGIIAGIWTMDPISWFLIPGQNDGRVAVTRTKVNGMTDHIIIPASHTFIANNEIAIRQTVSFLRTGSFTRPGPTHTTPAP